MPDAGTPTEPNDRLWQQLTNAVQLRSGQDQILWTIFGVFWAVQVLLLGALIDGGRFVDGRVGLPVSFAGVLVTATWAAIQNRALRHVRRYEELICQIEKALGLPKTPNLAISPDINYDAFRRFVSGRVKARSVMPLCVWALVVAWAGVVIYSSRSGVAAGSSLVWEEVATAISTGRLRFEVRDVVNESRGISTGTSYTHHGTVLATGDADLVSERYLAFFRITRVSGGDPNQQRRPDDLLSVIVDRGTGQFSDLAGFRAVNDTWTPEQIELTFMGAMPIASAK